MMKNIIEFVSFNKKVILKKTLILGGAVLALVIAGEAVANKMSCDLLEEPECDDLEETMDIESEVVVEKIEE